MRSVFGYHVLKRSCFDLKKMHVLKSHMVYAFLGPPHGDFGPLIVDEYALILAGRHMLHTLFWSMISTIVANLELSTKTTRPNSTNLQLAVLTVVDMTLMCVYGGRRLL